MPDLDDWTEEEQPLGTFEAPLREQYAATRSKYPEAPSLGWRSGYRIRPADADQDPDPGDLW